LELDSHDAQWLDICVIEIFLLTLLFFDVQSEEIADTLRSFAQLDSRKPLVAILDPSEQKVYTLPESVTDVTQSIIEELIDEFQQAAINYNPLLPQTDDIGLERDTQNLDVND